MPLNFRIRILCGTLEKKLLVKAFCKEINKTTSTSSLCVGEKYRDNTNNRMLPLSSIYPVCEVSYHNKSYKVRSI